MTHGRASSVLITVCSIPAGGSRIEALDSGKGIPADVLPGFGLREIGAAAGDWTLSPAPGQGALLTVTLPDLPMSTPAPLSERAHA